MAEPKQDCITGTEVSMSTNTNPPPSSDAVPSLEAADFARMSVPASIARGDGDTPRWIVLRTRSRHEKHVARSLHARGKAVFAPSLRVRSIQGSVEGKRRRSVQIDRLLFSG
ncbi:MAG: transcription termination/antitermination NusG family protein [Planctomycetota bacterium]